MHAFFKSRFARWEALRLESAGLLRSIPEAQRHLLAAEGKWSAIQIVTHIYDAERNALLYVRKKLQAGDGLKPAGIRGVLRFATLRLALALPIRFRAPEIIAQPDNSRTAEELLHAWEDLRNEWSQLLESIPVKYHNRALFKHPFAGKIHLRHALHFMADHLARHQNQLRDLQR